MICYDDEEKIYQQITKEQIDAEKEKWFGDTPTVIQKLNSISILEPQILKKEDFMGDYSKIYNQHDDKINLIIKVMPDGAGDFSHIYNYIRLFKQYGYKYENINIFVIIEKKLMYEFIENINNLIIFKNILVDNIYEILVQLKIEIEQYIKETTEEKKEQPSSVINITKFLNNFDIEKYLQILEKCESCIYNTSLKGNTNNFFRIIKYLKTISFIENVNYYFSCKIDNYKIESNKICYPFIDNYTPKNDIIVTFDFTLPKELLSLLSKCNKIIDMTEGGCGDYSQKDLKQCPQYMSGIGIPFIGFFQGSKKEIRQDINKTIIINYLSKYFNTKIEKYHLIYMGQLHKKDQYNKLSLFIKIISYIYIKSANNIIHILIQKSILQFYKFNNILIPSLEQHFKSKISIIDDKIIIKYDNNNTLIILFYNSFKNKLSKINTTIDIDGIHNEITFQELIKHSDDPIYMTGDLSYQESIVLGKITFHDCIYWKSYMIKKFIDTIKKYYTIKKYDTSLCDLLENYYLLMTGYGNREETLKAIYIILDKFDFSEALKNYNIFINNFVNEFYNADRILGLLIYLFRNNHIESDVKKVLIYRTKFGGKYIENKNNFKLLKMIGGNIKKINIYYFKTTQIIDTITENADIDITGINTNESLYLKLLELNCKFMNFSLINYKLVEIIKDKLKIQDINNLSEKKEILNYPEFKYIFKSNIIDHSLEDNIYVYIIEPFSPIYIIEKKMIKNYLPILLQD